MSVLVSAHISPKYGDAPIVVEDRLYTAEELLEMSSDTSRRYELNKGVLTIMSPAGGNHGDLAMGLGARMRIHAEDNELGVVFAAETGFRLETDPDTVLAPDVSFIAEERLPIDGVPRSYIPGTPDLAVEVVSPSDRASEVQSKVRDWLSYGTLMVWVVEPESETITVYRSDGSAAVLDETATLTGEDVLPGFELALTSLFR